MLVYLNDIIKYFVGIAVGNLKAVRKQKVGPEIQIDNMDESNLLGLTQAGIWMRIYIYIYI